MKLNNKIFLQPLNVVLSQNSICSKRACKNFLKNNLVLINGTRIFDSKFLVDTDIDEIKINNNKINFLKHIYLVLDKPKNTVCSTVSDCHETIFDYIEKILKDDDRLNFALDNFSISKKNILCRAT